MNLTVRRSALKMWALAMAGIPLLVIALDVLTKRKITNWLREIIFNPEDTQIYEPRDVIFAWAMFLFAAFLVLWGLKELFLPTKVIECRPQGLALRLRGPFRGPTQVRWVDIDDVFGSETVDEGAAVPVLVIRVLDRTGLPEHPWGARWVQHNELAVLAEDWSKNPEDVATAIIDCAVESARIEARARAERLSAAVEDE